MRSMLLLLAAAVIAGSSDRFRSNWFGVAGVICALMLWWAGQI